MHSLEELSELQKFVEKHTDEHCGLDVAIARVLQIDNVIKIYVGHIQEVSDGKENRIMSKRHYSYDMKKEWEDQALSLIKELAIDPGEGYGNPYFIFELFYADNGCFFLKEVQK